MTDAAICSDCGRPVETHAMFDPPRCPVIKLGVQWLCVYDGSTAPIEVVQPACPECGREMQRALKEQAVSAAPKRGTARLRWWKAGGLHAHVRYPDGSWLRQTWKLVGGEVPWWEIDSLRIGLENEGYSVDVTP